MGSTHSVNCLVLVGTFLVSGSIYTLSIKWADQSVACGVKACDTPYKFNHPFVQATAMFFGEFLCFIIYYLWMCIRYTTSCRQQCKTPIRHCLLFILPALLDFAATACAYTGLNLTFASSFEMLKGSLVIFTALLSVAFLHRGIKHFEWCGIAFVTVGLVVVGIGDFVFGVGPGSQNNTNSIVAGDLLIVIAQIANAAQFVCEEHFIRKYNVPPPLIVGLEGLFGSIILSMLLIPMYFIHGLKPFTSDSEHLEDVWDALAQIQNNSHIALAITGIIISIAVFNVCGVSITKEASATTRQIADVGRTIIVWIISLFVGWQPYTYRMVLMQTAGFVLLVIGIFIYNNIIIRPIFLKTQSFLSKIYGNTESRTSLNSADADQFVSLLRSDHAEQGAAVT